MNLKDMFDNKNLADSVLIKINTNTVNTLVEILT